MIMPLAPGRVRLVIDENADRYAAGAKSSSGPSFRPVSNWTGSNMDPDSVKRHYRGLQRAGFKDHAQVQGPYGF